MLEPYQLSHVNSLIVAISEKKMRGVYVFMLLLGWTAGKEELLNIRLPTHIVPIRYRLDMITHLEGNFTFHGKVWIDVRVEQETDRITLHSKLLKIDEEAIKVVLLQDGQNGTEGKSDIKINSHEIDTTKDFFILHLCTPLAAGSRYQLFISYSGILSDDLTGYYRQSYKAENSTHLSWVAATVFEPIEARRAFPCFDEPDLKASFQVNLARKKSSSTIANMPLRETEDMEGNPGWKWDHYEETPVMSTYLVAFVVGDLHYQETQSDGRTFRVWARPDKVKYSEYALSVAPRIVRYLEDYVGVQDAIPKTDLVALPNFVNDALENWGVISFGEKYILYQPELTSTSSKEYLLIVLAHELAHIWFGNIVTLRWWDSAWLNEGFATYFSVVAANQVEPQFDFISSMIVEIHLEVFSTDALRTSHPLTIETSKTTDLHHIFDLITYFKGYYLLRMLSHSLGEPTFRGGIGRYVSKNKFKNVVDDDLWSALTEQVHSDGVTLPKGTDVKALMKNWTNQAGHPVVKVIRNYSDQTANITQQRFLLHTMEDVEGQAIEMNTRWWIPLTFMSHGQSLSENSTQPQLWLDPAEDSVTIEGMPTAEKWVLFNPQASGIYRVNYDDWNWHLLADALDSEQHDKIPSLSRALILNDAMSLARANLLSYSVAFSITRFLHREDHYLTWKVALNSFNYLNLMLRTTGSASAFQNFLLGLVSPHFEKMGFDADKNDKASQNLHMKQIAKWACLLGHHGCITQARQRFSRWRQENLTTSEVIPVDMQTVIYCTAIAHGSTNDWEYLWSRFKMTNRGSEWSSILVALGCSPDTHILRRYLSLSLDEGSGIKGKNIIAVFVAVAENPKGNALAKSFFKENIETIQKCLGNNPSRFHKLLKLLASGMNQPKDLREIHQLRSKHNVTLCSADYTLAKAEEIVHLNIKWLKKYYSTIAKWLQSN